MSALNSNEPKFIFGSLGYVGILMNIEALNDPSETVVENGIHSTPLITVALGPAFFSRYIRISPLAKIVIY